MQDTVGIVIGASRGIGQSIAVTLGAAGSTVVVAAKSSDNTQAAPQYRKYNSLPGTIESVAQEITEAGGTAVPLTVDVRSEASINNLVSETLARYGKIDYIVYNAGSLWWAKVSDTPLKRFDLLHDVNARGLYAAVQAVLPHFQSRGCGRILVVSPPIYSRFFKGKTAYAMSKVGATVLVMGLAKELQGSGVAITAIWPATGIQSAVTDKLHTDGALLRKPQVFSDACLRILQAPVHVVNGLALVDEDFLRSHAGVTQFRQYRVDPDKEPPRMLPKAFPVLTVEEEEMDGVFKEKDIASTPRAKL